MCIRDRSDIRELSESIYGGAGCFVVSQQFVSGRINGDDIAWYRDSGSLYFFQKKVSGQECDPADADSAICVSFAAIHDGVI